MKGVRSTFSEVSIVIDSAVIDSAAGGASDPRGRARSRQAASRWRRPNYHVRFQIICRRIAARNRLSVPLFANSKSVRETCEWPVPDRDELGRGTARGIGACRAPLE